MKPAAAGASLERWKSEFGEHFDAAPESLIPALEFVQKQEGYLPREALAALSAYLRVPEAKVFGVASFYSLFHLQPRGRHRITVCRGTACHVRGSGRLLADLEKMLGVKAGDTTLDMQVSLETVACLGSCALAPVVVKEKVHGRASTASVKKLVDDIRNHDGGSSGSSRQGGTPKKAPRRGKRKV